MRPLKAIYSFIKLPFRAKTDILIIVFIYLKVSCLIKCYPLKKYHSKYFEKNDNKPVDLKPYQSEIKLIRKVIMQLPGKPTCLIESFVVYLFFKRKGVKIPIYLGVNTKDDFLAHAWYNEKHSGGYTKV